MSASVASAKKAGRSARGGAGAAGAGGAASLTSGPARRDAGRSPERSATADHADEHDDDGDDEENVDEPSHRVRGDDPEGPEQEQQDGDGPKHDGLPLKRSLLIEATATP